MAFFSGSLYRDVAKRWRGTGFAYLLLLIFLTTCMSTVVGYLHLTRMLDYFKAVAAHSVPVIQITEGEVSIDEPSPYRLRIPDHDETWVVIDTREKPISFADADSEVLITKTKIYVRKDEFRAGKQLASSEPGQYEVHAIPKQTNLVIDEAFIEKLSVQLKHWLLIVYFFGLLLLSFLYRVMQAVLYALIVRLYAYFLSVSLQFDACLRLACVAATPAILLATLFEVLGLGSSLALWIVYGLLTLGYLFAAVKSNQAKQAFDL